jgi:hypothetical protein
MSKESMEYDTISYVWSENEILGFTRNIQNEVNMKFLKLFDFYVVSL